MKILVVTPDSKMGGITSAAVNFCNELLKRGHNVYFLDLSLGYLCAEKLEDGVQLGSLKGISRCWNLGKSNIQKGSFFKRVGLGLLGFFKKLTVKSGLWYKLIFKRYKQFDDFDIAVAFRQCAPCYSFVLNKVQAEKKIGFVHGELKHMGDISSWKKYMSTFDKIAYVSNSVQKEFVTAYPELKNNACTIYNMFDVEKIKSLALEANPLTFDKSIKNIVTVARIDNDFKRIDWIPQMCAEIAKKTKQAFHWYIIGDGPDFDEVKSLINNYGVQDYVTMVGATNNPYAIWKDADFSVLLSKSEAYPMTVIETFILDIPIVVSRFGSIDEMMQNGKHGLIAESSQSSLIEFILQFFEDEELLRQCKEFLLNIEYANDKEYKQFLEAVGGEECFQ